MARSRGVSKGAVITLGSTTALFKPFASYSHYNSNNNNNMSSDVAGLQEETTSCKIPLMKFWQRCWRKFLSYCLAYCKKENLSNNIKRSP